jgi:hypothetical protein
MRVNVGHWPVEYHSTAGQLVRFSADCSRLAVTGVRFMNWLRAYENQTGGRWLDYADDWQYTGGAWADWRGYVPLAICLESAERVGLPELYVNLPYWLDDAGVEAAAVLLWRWAEAGAGRRLWVTVGNEPWNTAGPYATQHARFAELGGGDWVAGYVARLQALARRLPGQVVAECHTMNADIAQRVLRLTGSDVALAIAPYFGRGTVTEEETLGGIIGRLSADLFGPVTAGIIAHGRLADNYGVRLVGYEAGHHLRGGSEALAWMWRAGLVRGLWYPALRRAWEASGGDSLYWYRLRGDGRGEFWGLA